MKAGRYLDRPLAGKTLAMIFTKSSTRTRVSFEVGAQQLGGQAIFLSARDIQLGRGEPIRDTARVLSRYVHGIMIRTFAHNDVEELARFAPVPVINGLTDLLHPCQVMADLMTVREALGGWAGKSRLDWRWQQHGQLLDQCGRPARLRAPHRLPRRLRSGCSRDRSGMRGRRRFTLMRDPAQAAADAHVVTTDVWASMGQEEEAEKRRVAFQGYLVDEALMAVADKGAIFLHCLPAHRGEEVADAVLEGPQSRVWDEAENRLHVQKASWPR